MLLSHIPSAIELDSMKESRLELEEHFSDGIPQHGKMNLAHAGVSVIVHEKLFTKKTK